MELGYDRASIDEIADRLGATKGRVYHYYRSKVDLLLDIHIEMLGLMLEEIEAAATADEAVLVRLENMARIHARLMMNNLAYARVTLISSAMLELAQTDKQRATARSIRRARATYEAFFQDLIQRAADQHDLRDLDPVIAVRAFLGTLNWVGMWFQRGRNTPSDIETIADELATFAVSGLLPR